MSLVSALTSNQKLTKQDVTFKNINVDTIDGLPYVPGGSDTISIGTATDNVIYHPVFVPASGPAEHLYIDEASPLAYVPALGLLSTTVLSAVSAAGGGTISISNSLSQVNITIAIGGLAPYPLVLPNGQGAAGETLRNDGAGNLSWGV